jgi:hypothetical protein
MIFKAKDQNNTQIQALIFRFDKFLIPLSYF